MSPVCSRQRFLRESKKKNVSVTQTPLNVFDLNEGPGIETHPTGGARSCSHGIKFEREMAMLWTYRAYRTGRDYTVAIEDERTGKFDDYYLCIKLEDGTFLQQFVQMKHSSQKESALTVNELFPKPKNAKHGKFVSKNVFDLQLYFKSFVAIKNCPEFNLKEKSKEMFIIFTNKILKFGGSIENFEFCESIFEKVRDTEILNTDLWKFKDEFPGRKILQNLLGGDVSDQEYTDQFLKNFYIAHSQRNEPSGSELLKSELCYYFKGIQCENAYNKYCTNFLDWYKARDNNKGTRLSHNPIREYFIGIKDHIVELTSFELMDPTPNFYGREDIIANIHHNLVTLNRPTSHVIDVSISGMSGVGKTEIARYYAKKHRSEYDYILWMNASSSQSLEESFLRLKLFLNISDNNNLDNKNRTARRCEKSISEDQIKRIYTFLESYKCLFIFDSDLDLLHKEFQTETRKYLPLMKSKKHHLIVTTNKRRLLCSYEEHVVNFSETETLGFLKQNLDSNLYNNDSELNNLGFILSNVTLALQIATSYIKEQNRRCLQFLGKSFTVIDFLSSYQEKNQSILDFKSEGLANKPLITICELSIQSIVNSKEKRRCLALEILYFIAYLQPDHIPTKMFVSKKISLEDLMDAISILENFSLITVSPGYLHIHRLTQDILRAKLQQNSKEMNKVKVRKYSKNKLYFVDKKGRALISYTNKLIAIGKYTKEYILHTGFNIFENFNHKFVNNNGHITTENVIVRHTLTFIFHCIDNNYITRLHLVFILNTIGSVSEHGMCLECIEYLKIISNNLKYITSEHECEYFKFLITLSMTNKYYQVGDFYNGLESAMECQDIIEEYEIPFSYILIYFLLKTCLLKNAGRKEECFQTLMKLYILFDEYTNVQNQKLLYSTVKHASGLGKLLLEHSQFLEATKVNETIQQHVSYMCQNNQIPNNENCQCIESALALSNVYGIQKKYFEAKEVLLRAKNCTRVPSNENEIKMFSIFFASLCHGYYQCGEISKALSVLDQVSKTRLPPPLGESVTTKYFKMVLRQRIAIYLEFENKFDLALDILRAEIFNLLVIFKSHKILNFIANIELDINNIVTNIAVTHSQAQPFKILLFNAIRLSYSYNGFEIAHADLLKFEKSVVFHFGEINEIYSYILMCKLSLYRHEKRFESEMKTWIKLFQILYELSKDSSSFFIMFRITLIKFLRNTQQLEQDNDSFVSESLLGIVNKAIRSAETSLIRENQTCAPLMKLLYFDCLILTKKYDSAKEYGLKLLSTTDSNNIGDINVKYEIYLKLANHLHNNKKESFEAIKFLNQCIQNTKNIVCRGSGYFFHFRDEFRPLHLTVTIVKEQFIYEFRIVQRVKCCIEKSKIYFDTGEPSKGLNMLQDCMHKIHNFDITNASFIPPIKEILLLLFRVGETEEALRYIDEKCKLDDNNLDASGACDLLRIKAKLQYKMGDNENAVKTLLKLWNKKLILVLGREIYSYQNIDYINKIQCILLELEHRKSIALLDLFMEDNEFQLMSKQKVGKLEIMFCIAFCNYLLEKYIECMGELKSIEGIFECDQKEMKNEEIDNIIFDVSILLKCCVKLHT